EGARRFHEAAQQTDEIAVCAAFRTSTRGPARLSLAEQLAFSLTTPKTSFDCLSVAIGGGRASEAATLFLTLSPPYSPHPTHPVGAQAAVEAGDLPAMSGTSIPSSGVDPARDDHKCAVSGADTVSSTVCQDVCPLCPRTVCHRPSSGARVL